MKYLITSVFLLISFYLNPVLANEFPSCVQMLSDQDGDGYGYENSRTCIVDDTTSHSPVPGACVDDNADGYGWDGVASCLVPEIPTTDCVDTDPVGDGWGWDGSVSCRVVQVTDEPMSELEIIKNNLIDVAPQGTQHYAVLYCPRAMVSYILKIYGRIDRYHETDYEYQATGMWSSGMYDKDMLLHYTLQGQSYFGFIDLSDTSDIKVGGESCVFF